MNFPLLAAALSLCLTSSLGAQQVLTYHVNFPTGDAEWTAIFEKRKGQPEAEAGSDAEVEERKHAIREIEVVRKAGLRRDIMKMTDGSQSEVWWTPNSSFVLMEAGKSKTVVALKPSVLGDRRLDQSIFGWIGQETFQKQLSFRGRQCLYFSNAVVGHQFSDSNERDKSTMEAWLDAKTLEPVAWSNGENLVSFRFKPVVSSGPLIMPEKFEKEYRKWSVYLDRKKS